MRILTLLAACLMIIGCNNSAKTKEGTKDTARFMKEMLEKPATDDTVLVGFGNEAFWTVYVFHPADGPDVEVP